MTTKPFRSVALPVRVHGGPNVIARLSDEVDRLRAQRVFVVCGQTVAHKTDLLDRVKESLGGKFAGVFDAVQASSPLPSVELATAQARDAKADLIVALGGGSAVVTTRALIILLAEGGRAQDHATQYPPGQPPVSPRLMKPKIPNIVVLTTPTTAVTRAGTAVLDLETGHRVELFDPKTLPAAVFLDTDALLTAPTWLCLSAAASCFSGVVGALQSPEQANPLAEGDLIQALGLLRRDMQLVKSQEESGRSRVNLCAAAILMNRAMDSGAGGGVLGVVSSLAHSLDSGYPECSHGDAYAVLTAPGIAFNRDFNLAGQARLASIMGVMNGDMDDRRGADAAAAAVAETYRQLEMPSRLREVGVPEDGVKQIAVDSMTDFGITRNVRPVKDAAELDELLKQIW